MENRIMSTLQQMYIEELENAIKEANKQLSSGEGVDLLYYMEDHSKDTTSIEIIRKLIKSGE